MRKQAKNGLYKHAIQPALEYKGTPGSLGYKEIKGIYGNIYLSDSAIMERKHGKTLKKMRIIAKIEGADSR